jgi:hypothetical protein
MSKSAPSPAPAARVSLRTASFAHRAPRTPCGRAPFLYRPRTFRIAARWWYDYDKQQVGPLISTITDDINAVQDFASTSMMVAVPDPQQLDAFPTDPRSGGPWVMWKGTKYAHLMVPTAAMPKPMAGMKPTPST